MASSSCSLSFFHSSSNPRFSLVCACLKLLQSCPTLCNPMGCNPPGSSVHGILQARILEWIAMPSSRGSSPPRDWTWVSLRLLYWQVGSLPLAPLEKPRFSLRSSVNLNFIPSSEAFVFPQVYPNSPHVMHLRSRRAKNKPFLFRRAVETGNTEGTSTSGGSAPYQLFDLRQVTSLPWASDFTSFKGG